MVKQKVDKSRNFAIILYPESLPENAPLLLTELGRPMALSPLHDKDVNKNGEFKKPHYHLMYIAPSPTTVSAIQKKFNRKGFSVYHAEIVEDVANYYLYLTHDSKSAIAQHKHKYNKSDIQLFNDFDIDRYIVLDDSQKEDILNLIVDVIDQQEIGNLMALERYLNAHCDEIGCSPREYRKIMRANSVYLGKLCTGAFQEKEQREKEQSIRL